MMMKSIRNYTLAMACLFTSQLVFAKQPNIVFIMADDHAKNAISAYQGRLANVVKTPNIDKLAKTGVRLDGMFTNNAISSPSLAAILTGQYSHKNGVKTSADALAPMTNNLAKALQGLGYQTAVVGKWPLKSEPFGFDYYRVLLNQGQYFDPKFKEIGTRWQSGEKDAERVEGYVTDVITDISIDWLDKRELNKPFMLMIQHETAAEHWQPAKRHQELFADDFIPEPDSLYRRERHGPTDAVIIDGKKGQQFGSSVSRRTEGRSIVTRMTEPDWPTGPLELDTYDWKTVVSAGYQKFLKDYLRTLVSVDDSVGRVVSYLAKQDLLDNTLIIYTSDQGMLLGEHDYYDKRWMYEESMAMPFIASYPGVIPANSQSDALLLNLDIAPTLLEIAGQKSHQMQGQSFAKVLTSPSEAQGRDAIYYRYWMHMTHHFVPAHYGIRTKEHKLAFFYGLPLDAKGAMPAATPPYWEMYDLSKDPNEMVNIYPDPQNDELKAKLKQTLSKLKQEVQDLDSTYPQLQKLAEQHWLQ